MVVAGEMGRSIVDYKFRSGIFGGEILQVGYEEVVWDTNTGMDVDSIISYRDATKEEAEAFLESGGV